jgi:hypothetical protein
MDGAIFFPPISDTKGRIELKRLIKKLSQMLPFSPTPAPPSKGTRDQRCPHTEEQDEAQSHAGIIF